MSSLYLSIDLDVFACAVGTHFLVDRMKPHFDRIMGEVVRRDTAERRVKVVMSHEKLLPAINRSGCTELWNVDYHSDLENAVDTIQEPWRCDEVDCGTWVSFVHWRKTGKFVWVQPHGSSWNNRNEGRCDSHRCLPDGNPFIQTDLTDWSRTKVHNLSITIPWSKVTHVGIAGSPDYTCLDCLKKLVAEASPEIQTWFKRKTVFLRASQWLHTNSKILRTPCLLSSASQIC
ncbi:MAG: hypothetical protein UY48_C0003G0036 [Candidatus Gottesmanbacteria bacterium GW2011_GWB1_49_7]|uniref:Uncharacterized protein n=1 Tax=Candidatus Gottesmanbacteria bacterium GW2011_GWB1_49_7 TaxID=1618448 RepID=A0A0G1Z369_9BACT|nr:MAG: hypothetical protein UY48_C0003G0036 [Candidatus Gottesmanbacteria bacterium GW2011_GWB1_49_7]